MAIKVYNFLGYTEEEKVNLKTSIEHLMAMKSLDVKLPTPKLVTEDFLEFFSEVKSQPLQLHRIIDLPNGLRVELK